MYLSYHCACCCAAQLVACMQHAGQESPCYLQHEPPLGTGWHRHGKQAPALVNGLRALNAGYILLEMLSHVLVPAAATWQRRVAGWFAVSCCGLLVWLSAVEPSAQIWAAEFCTGLVQGVL